MPTYGTQSCCNYYGQGEKLFFWISWIESLQNAKQHNCIPVWSSQFLGTWQKKTELKASKVEAPALFMDTFLEAITGQQHQLVANKGLGIKMLFPTKPLQAALHVHVWPCCLLVSSGSQAAKQWLPWKARCLTRSLNLYAFSRKQSNLNNMHVGKQRNNCKLQHPQVRRAGSHGSFSESWDHSNQRWQ